MPFGQLLRTLDQGVAVAGAENQAKGLQHATDLDIELGAHRHKLVAGTEQNATLVRDDAFGVDLAEPAHPQHVDKTAGVTAVGLAGPHGQGRVGVAGIHAHYGQPVRGQSVEQLR